MVAMVTPRWSSYLINFSLVFLVACLLISASLSGSKDAPRDLHKCIRERAVKDGFESGVLRWEDVIFSLRIAIVNSEWILSVRNDKFLDEILSQSPLVGTNKDELCTTLTKPITSATHSRSLCNWHINNETPIFPRHSPVFYCGYMLIWCRISSRVVRVLLYFGLLYWRHAQGAVFTWFATQQCVSWQHPVGSTCSTTTFVTTTTASSASPSQTLWRARIGCAVADTCLLCCRHLLSGAFSSSHLLLVALVM